MGAVEFAGRDGPRFVFRETGGPARLLITLLEPGIVRVQVQPLGHATVARTWAVVGNAGETGPEGRDREDLSVFSCPEPLATSVSDGAFHVRDHGFRLNLDLASAALSVALEDGSPLLTDHSRNAYRSSSRPAPGGSALPRSARRTN